jgi:hypothetical protein
MTGSPLKRVRRNAVPEDRLLPAIQQYPMMVNSNDFRPDSHQWTDNFPDDVSGIYSPPEWVF